MAIARGFLFRENALWNSNTGYALSFGKGTTLLVTPGEFLVVNKLLFLKRNPMGPVETQLKFIDSFNMQLFTVSDV